MKQILASIVVQAYALDFGLCEKLVNCENAKVVGFEWFTPIVNDGLLQGYRAVVFGDKPTPDSIKTIKVTVDGRTINVAVTDDAPITAFSDACNACCGNGTPVIAAPAVPEVLYEENLCPDDKGDYRITAFAPFQNGGQKLFLSPVTCNGETLDPLPPEDGFANMSALVQFAQANYGDKGEFSFDEVDTGHGIHYYTTLVTKECQSASISIGLLKQKFCAPVNFPVTYDELDYNGKAKHFPARTANTMNELISQLSSDMADGQLTGSGTLLQYDGTGVPSGLKYQQGQNVVSWSIGQCS